MKTALILSVYFLFIVGCASTYIQPSFEDSNQYFLEKTINQLDLVIELDGRISPKYNIALLSIEDNFTLDKPIITMIEDQIISSLIKGGYTIVERDTDAIQNIIKEGNKKYSLTFKIPSENITYEELIGDALNPGINFIETKLSAAEVLISYRILEAGIVYHEHPENKNYKIREAMVRLHIRVHKTWTGEIVHATNLNSSMTDTLRDEFINQLESFHYSFFPYEYPLQEDEKQKSALLIKSVKRISNKTSNRQWTFYTKIGGGANEVGWANRLGPLTGGSISYGKINEGGVGADLNIFINTNSPTLGLTGFYKRSILKNIFLKGGLCYLQTWAIPTNKINIGGTAGIGISLPIGEKFILQPMAEFNFGSIKNNIFGAYINLGFSL